MDFTTKTHVLLTLFGIIHAKDWKPEIYAQGKNATVHIDLFQMNGNEVLETTFSGYTRKKNVINVMVYDPKNKTDIVSINTDYAGRIQTIEMNNGSLSFLLLNVNFMDSGNYTVFEGSQEKGKTSILVPRHILLGQSSGPIIFPFMFDVTTTSLIKIEMIMSKQTRFPVVTYDVAGKNCTEFGNLFMNRIERCVSRGNNFSFTIQNVSFVDMGVYLAWDDVDFLIDSVFVDIQGDVRLAPTTNGSPYSSKFDTENENNTTSSSPFIPNLLSSEAENYKLEWFLVSAVVVVLVAAGLITNALGKLRQRRVSKKTINNLTHRNERQNTANSSRNWFQNAETEHTPEGTRMVLREDNDSDNLTDFMYNKSHLKVRLNEKHLSARGIDSAKSAVSKLQIHSILPSSCDKLQSDPAHEYDHVHEYDELENDCRSDEPYLRSMLLSTHTIEHIAEHSCKYDYAVQHSYTTLRPPAQYPIVTTKKKELVTIADSFSRHNKVNKKSPLRVDPSTFYANVSQKRPSEFYCTGSRAELGSHAFSNKLALPSSFELEDSFSMDTMDLPNWSQYRRCQRNRNSECFSSNIYIPRPESSEHQDFKCQSVSQTLNYNYGGNVLDDSSAKKRGHRRSKSCGDLCEDLMVKSSARRSQRSPVRVVINEECCDSL